MPSCSRGSAKGNGSTTSAESTSNGTGPPAATAAATMSSANSPVVRIAVGAACSRIAEACAMYPRSGWIDGGGTGHTVAPTAHTPNSAARLS